MDLLQHQKRLEDFFDIVDPPRRNRARELLLSLSSEEELFTLLEEEYGEFFRSQNSPESQAEQVDTRPVCKYGTECYRKNPVHFKEFLHPWSDKK
jgi:hypothetical protein